MPSTAKPSYRPGDRVRVRLGSTVWRARIVEDRGPIGKNRRHLLRLQIMDDQQDPPHFIEAPADDVEAVEK